MSGRDELMWFAIHKCMEAMLRISLYSYLYPKLAKVLCLSWYLLCFFFDKIGEQKGGRGSAWKCVCVCVGGVADTMYIHVNKCKNDKIKHKNNTERIN
jgi:hypothetical protein